MFGDKRYWGGFTYVFILLLFIGRKTLVFFSPSGREFFYYYFLTAFSKKFLFFYIVNSLQVVLSLIHVAPVILYILRITWLPSQVWQTLFFFRIFCDVAGNSFGWSYLISLYYADPRALIFVAITSLCPYIPSYVMCYRYAFRRKTYLSPTFT